MLLYKPNVMILNFYVLENSVWLDSLFLIFFQYMAPWIWMKINLHLKPWHLNFCFLKLTIWLFLPWYNYCLKHQPFKSQNDKKKMKSVVFSSCQLIWSCRISICHSWISTFLFTYWKEKTRFPVFSDFLAARLCLGFEWSNSIYWDE